MEFFGFTIDLAALTEDAISLLIKFAIAVVIFIIGKWLAKQVSGVSQKLMSRSRLDDTVATFLSNLIYWVLLVIVSLAALNKVGIQTTSVVAILGGMAVAIGLSLKDQLSNFAAGVLIVIFRPFVRGDFVKIGSYEGTVKEISLVNTHLTTLNNHEIIIPNGDITTSATLNYTSLPNRRVDITVGIGYSADIKTAKEVMLRLAKAHPLAFKDPEPVIRVTNLGDNSVDLTLNVWATNGDWWTLQCDLLEQFKYALDDQGIDIPFPQRSVHVAGLEHLIKAQQDSESKEVGISTAKDPLSKPQ